MNKDQKLKIAILGAGESGNGAALLAKAKGHDVFVSDFGLIKSQYKNELQAADIVFEEGGHTIDKLKLSDLIIKSPGISDKVEIVQQLKVAGKKIISEVEWAFRFKGNSKVIAITGSNGKSTTTSLVYHLLKSNGMDVSIVGNIGISFSKQVATHPTEWYVLEISSFQLDDIERFKPEVAVLLNITPDHLDRYDFKFEKYAASKFLITKNQNKDDLLVLNADDATTNDQLKNEIINARTIYMTMNENKFKENEDGAFLHEGMVKIKYDDDYLGLPIKDIPLLGKHNVYNTMAAGISAMAAGLRSEALRNSFSAFEGLEHRLEFVAKVRDVTFINDSKGTNLNSVWYALESMEQPVILILGGQDKGNDYNEIMDLVTEKVKAIVCLGKDNSPIHNAFDGVVPIVGDAESAKAAVDIAYQFASKGDVVLLSPGCASFDLFKNYEDRGRQFKEAVNEL